MNASNQDSKMTLLCTQGHRKKENLSSDSIICTAQDYHKDDPPPTQKDQVERSSSTKRLPSEVLEAKRAMKRQSAHRCGLRQKLRIERLYTRNSLLNVENTNLRLKLELAQAENKKLLQMEQQQQQRVFNRSRALHGMLKRQFQDQLRDPTSIASSTSDTTGSFAFLELANQSPATAALVHDSPRASLEYGQAELHLASSPEYYELAPLSPSRFGTRDLSLGTSSQSHTVQKEIQRLREEVKSMKDFLARHSI